MEGVLDLREKLAKLMYGRYGVDQLGRAMLIFALVLCVLSLFVPRRLSGIIYYITYFNYFDVYKNVFKKYSEALPGEQQIFKFKSFLLKKISA